MKPQSKKQLEDYKNNALPPENREGIEQSIIREATRLADRAKWKNMLAEEGISRTDMPLIAVKEDVKKPTGIIRRLAPYAIGLAAAIAFLVMFVFRTESYDDMILKNRQPAVEVRMGTNEDIAAWKKAMEAYRNNRFAESTDLINSITTPTNEQKFYLALSTLYQTTPDYAKAAVLFQDFVARKDPFYEEEARWFYAYSLFKAGKKDAAKTVLEEIVSNKGYNHEKALKALKQL